MILLTWRSRCSFDSAMTFGHSPAVPPLTDTLKRKCVLWFLVVVIVIVVLFGVGKSEYMGVTQSANVNFITSVGSCK